MKSVSGLTESVQQLDEARLTRAPKGLEVPGMPDAKYFIIYDQTAGEPMPESLEGKYDYFTEAGASEVFKLLSAEAKAALSKTFDGEDLEAETWPAIACVIASSKKLPPKVAAEILNARITAKPKKWWDVEFD